MSNKAERILLTGGAGFIGSHLSEALLSCGHQLNIVDNLDNFYPLIWKRSNLEETRRRGIYNLYEVDIRDSEKMKEVFRKTCPNVVIHLAARAGVRPSIMEPALYQTINVEGTLNLLELCREFTIRKFIFGSSSSVYGATSKAPFSEGEVQLRPISPYAATKLSGELICYTYAHLFRFPVICLRFFTVYGPRQRPDLAIYKFTSLIDAGKTVPIFGDGTSGRDYTYVDDIVSGILATLDYEARDSSGAPFDIFNLGNSQPITLNELVHQLEITIGREATQRIKPMPPGDVPLTWADISKAHRLLGYTPRTSLAEGLRRFVTWYRSQASYREAVPLDVSV